jgi:hypothetical protein
VKTIYRVCSVCYAVYSSASQNSIKKHQGVPLTNFEQELAEAATNFVVGDARAFRTIDTNNFKALVKVIADVAVRASAAKIPFNTSMFPTSYDIAKQLTTKYEEAKKLFITSRLPVAKRNGCSITMHFSNKGTDYLVVTLHYFNDSWNVQSQILEFVAYPLFEDTDSENEDEEPRLLTKTVPNVSRFFEVLMKENGWEENEIREMMIVTDEGSTFSFANHQRCACHIFNIIALRVIQPYKKTNLATATKQRCGEVNEELTKMQQFVVEARNDQILKESLGTILRVPVFTRWMSKLHMITNFMDGKEVIKEALRNHHPEMMSAFEELANSEILNSYVKIIQPLEVRIKVLEGDTKVTISKYAVAFGTLYDYWTNLKNSEDVYTSALATSGLEVLIVK